eukprot:420778-Heterocapsa_arctica.AAC.1
MDAHPPSAGEPHRDRLQEIGQDPRDPTCHGWSFDDEFSMGTDPNGTQDIPFDSRELEHWHAWEAEPDCVP